MTENALRCDTCQNYESGGQWCAFLKERISNLEFTLIERVGCGAHPDSITLTPTLAQHYTELAKTKGKSVGMLVNADLTALHRKRVAREEKRAWKEIEYERL
jgi:hypothetical protein